MTTTINTAELAGRDSDPKFHALLSMLPNPDPILRKAGKTDEVFDAIQSDSHVIGELRLIKADLLRFKHNLVPGGDGPKEKRAFELCQAFLGRRPAPMMTWPNVTWNVGRAPFRGHSVQEIVWERSGNELMPQRLLDRPNRRFAFAADGSFRLLTRAAPLYGVPAEDAYFMVNRHMPSYDNPYGVALFSSCLWPYLFKHAGFKWFVKYCERLGIPFPVGSVPQGSGDDEQSKMEEALAELIDAGFAVIQEGGSIQLLEAKGTGSGGKLAQHLLIEASNAEMSKAVTSQTLSTEQPGSGSRAASLTGRERSADVNEGDRDAIAFTYDHLWGLITRLNFGEGVNPPTSEFLNEEAATKDRAETYEIFVRTGGKPSRKAMAADLGITLADPNDPEDQLQAAAPARLPGNDLIAEAAAEFARSGLGMFPDQDAIDEVNLDGQLQALAAQLLEPLFERVKQGVPPEELLVDLAALYPMLDDKGLESLLARVFFVADVWGRLSAEAEVDGG